MHTLSSTACLLDYAGPTGVNYMHMSSSGALFLTLTPLSISTLAPSAGLVYVHLSHAVATLMFVERYLSYMLSGEF